MHLLYMDESGVEEIGQGTSHFVLLGVLIPAESWKGISEALDGVKAAFDLRETEIHAAWMHRRYMEQESVDGFAMMQPAERLERSEKEIRRRAGVLGVSAQRAKLKAYRREANSIRPYLHLTRDQRMECLAALARTLVDFEDVRIFADAISKLDFVPGIARTPYEMAFEQVVTRTQACLGTKGDLGIVISDNNSKAAPRLTALSRKFHAEGTLYRAIPNIVETPLFVDSALIVRAESASAFGTTRADGPARVGYVWPMEGGAEAVDGSPVA